MELDDATEFAGYIAHAPNRLPVAMPLEDGRYLYLVQTICLRRTEKFLTTLEYRYAYQAAPGADSWIVRWEYQREPGEDYPYPRAHLHVNSSPDSYAGRKRFNELHIPTGRVTVEDVCRHLVDEHAVGPVSSDWRETLRRTEADFREIQRKRFAD